MDFCFILNHPVYLYLYNTIGWSMIKIHLLKLIKVWANIDENVTVPLSFFPELFEFFKNVFIKFLEIVILTVR